MRSFMIAGCLVAATVTACMTEDAPAPGTDTASEELGVCRVIRHYTYAFGGSVYRWDITEEDTGRVFADERRIGGGFYRQYRVTPGWSWCPHPNELLTLRASDLTLVGIHNCLPDGREEFHGQDRQRLLVPQVPFVTTNCDP